MERTHTQGKGMEHLVEYDGGGIRTLSRAHGDVALVLSSLGWVAGERGCETEAHVPLLCRRPNLCGVCRALCTQPPSTLECPVRHLLGDLSRDAF